MPQTERPPVVDAAANDDESARINIAVRALGDMRSRASAPEGRASSHNSRNGEQEDTQQPDLNRDFVSRMSSFPLVGSAIRVYEQGKASSRVVKYGAQMVESSVKTISKPVIDRLPVGQIDEFACRQLDRLDKYRRPSVGPESPRSPVSPSRTHSTMSRRMSDVNDAGPSSASIDYEASRGRPKLRTKTLDGSLAPEGDDETRQDESEEQREYVGSDRSVPQWIESTHSYKRTPGSASEVASPILEDSSSVGSPIIVEDRRTPENLSSDSQTSRRRRFSNSDRETQSSEHQQSPNPERQVAQRSRWQAMLLEAGGLGVALSDENMRRLKYCLNWLLYATAHIDAQILILRDFIESIQPIRNTTSNPHRRPPISEEQLRKLTEVRKDIVSTVRQMVDVVSKYAGGALPEPARSRVRGFILKLPQRWASRTAAAGVVAGSTGGPTSSSSPGSGERETVAAAGSGTGALRRGQGRDKRAAHRERGTGSRAASPAPTELSTYPSQSGSLANQQISHSNASAAAQRILSLATESLDMMRNVTGVVKDSLDRADAWVNRLRMVGVQRGSGQQGSSTNDELLNEEFGPPRVGSQYDPASSHMNRDDYRALFQTHRRGTSNSSIHGDIDEITTSFSGSTPASPFTTTTSLSHTSFLSNSSSVYTAASGSSMPSTPTGATPTSSLRDTYGGTVANAPSPGAIPLSAMHIASRFNTPKVGIVGLPGGGDGDEDEGQGQAALTKNRERDNERERERERGGQGLARMDVDEES